MKNTEIRIFYSWQSDLPNSETRGLIQDSISSAVKMLRDTVEIEADRDTKGEYGSPDIVQTIFSKIDECDIFIADVSIVNKYSSITDESENGNVRYGPNPNVMLELGYAASVVGWENVICILDTDYGSPDDLPFDLAHHRLSPYSLKEKTKKDVKKYIRDIITDTVSNLLENGPRVKSNFSNLVVGCYNQESNEITKEAWSYSPFEYFDSVIKDRGIAGCKQLISEINDIHLEPCIVEEPKEQPQVSSNISEMLGSINLFGDTPQRVIITEKEKESIISFSMEYPEIKLMDDFFELGNLKKKVSFHIGGSGTTYEGTEEEKLKYEKINELDYRIAQMQMMEMYSRTFDDYFLFPLAIRNVSTIADDEISISVIISGANTATPSREIINPDLQGIEGLIYEDGIIKEFLLMNENSKIKYETNISYSISDSIDSFKLYGVNGAHFDAKDYERELSKYIAEPQGLEKNEYEFYIKALRPKETCWLGPMIMLKRSDGDICIRYSIKSNKSDGNLSGEIKFSVV